MWHCLLEVKDHIKLPPTENFCEKEKKGNYNFSRTAVGLFAYSDEKCEENTSGEFCIDT